MIEYNFICILNKLVEGKMIDKSIKSEEFDKKISINKTQDNL